MYQNRESPHFIKLFFACLKRVRGRIFLTGKFRQLEGQPAHTYSTGKKQILTNALK